MTNSSAIRTAWGTVFAHNTMQTITPNAYAWDAASLETESAAHQSKYMHEQKVNFFQYQVIKRVDPVGIGFSQNTFRVRVQYYKEADLPGVAYNAIEDAFETLRDLVASFLGASWGGLIDYYQTPDAPEITPSDLVGRQIWMGQIDFIARSAE